LKPHVNLLSLQHAIVLDLDAAAGTSFFGVYDGHGGLIFTHPNPLEQVSNA